MDWSTIDLAAVIQAVIALVAALFGIKFGGEKLGFRVPLLTPATEAERRIKLIGKLDALHEQLGFTADERQKVLSGVMAKFGPAAAADKSLAGTAVKS